MMQLWLPKVVFGFKVFRCVLFAGIFPTMAYGQLQCKTQEISDSTITRCYHSNRLLSTSIIWDKHQRFGYAKAWDAKGNQIIDYAIRRFAGHASVYFQYHTNGQISKAEYRSAPDGGIQFEHIVHIFDEHGKQLEYTDLSQPDGHPVIMVPRHHYDREKLKIPQVLEPPPPEFEEEVIEFHQEVVKCAVPYVSVFIIQNVTGRKVDFLLNKLPNIHYSHANMDQMRLSSGKEREIYRITMAEQYVPPQEAYEWVLKSKGKRKQKYRIKMLLPENQGTTRIYRWIIVQMPHANSF
jgi:hypothetical protein